MNKKLLIGLAIVVLVILGYFAMQDNNTATQHTEMGQSPGMEMEEMAESALDLVHESLTIPFSESYSLDEEWTMVVDQFEPNGKIVGPGTIASDSDKETNPAIKVNFFKKGELIHYQIVFKEMPGFHSVKPDQKYLLDFIDYKGFKALGDNKFAIKNANLKIWRIK